jgi:replicative DNA helicase
VKLVEVLNAEQALLGSIIKKGDLIKEIALENNHFIDNKHQTIFTAMKSLEHKNEPIDIVTLKTQLGKEIEYVGGTEYLSDLKIGVPSIHSYKTYEKHVVDSYKLRTAKGKMVTISGINDTKDINHIQSVLSEVQELLESGQEKAFDMNEALRRINEDIETKKEGINGITTGFSHLDHLLDGWKLQDLNIVAARPSMGKTAFALSLANAAAKNGDYVDIFSLEMSAELLLKRMICMIGGIDSMKLKNARKYFNDDDWHRYTMSMATLSKYKDNLNINDQTSPTVQEIRGRVRQSIRSYPNQRHVVIIDYLTLIKGSGRGERHLEVGEISRTLKGMARDLNCSVILLSQLSRKVEQRQEKRPMLSDIRDSGEVEQDADTISFLYRDDYYNVESESKDIIEVIVGKNRNGPLGTVELYFNKKTNTFADLKR